MGIDWDSLKFLLACRRSGVHFTRSLTLGRQGLSIDDRTIRMLFQRYGALPAEFEAVLESGGGYPRGGQKFAKGLFKLLGAQEVISIDTSDYEGASVIHDMNVPLPTEHNGRY